MSRLHPLNPAVKFKSSFQHFPTETCSTVRPFVRGPGIEPECWKGPVGFVREMAIKDLGDNPAPGLQTANGPS